jgi:septum formation protein
MSLNSEVLHKPEDLMGLERRLLKLSGQTHLLHSAAALALNGSILFETSDEAFLTCRLLTPDFIARYIDLAGEKALASVGGYAIEGLGIQLFERIEGQQATILGLPMLELLAHFRRMGHLAG